MDPAGAWWRAPAAWSSGVTRPPHWEQNRESGGKGAPQLGQDVGCSAIVTFLTLHRRHFFPAGGTEAGVRRRGSPAGGAGPGGGRPPVLAGQPEAGLLQGLDQGLEVHDVIPGQFQGWAARELQDDAGVDAAQPEGGDRGYGAQREGLSAPQPLHR